MNVNQKIYELESQIADMQSEIELLKKYLHTSEQIPSQEPNQHFNESIRMATPESNSFNQTYEEQETTTPPKRNLENIFGKYFMGIAASILIFIALILFGVLIYRNFTDTMKIFVIYGISTVLLVIGCLLLHRKKNAFSLSLTGCALGAFYTSLIVTYTYFHRINDITLYLLLFIWVVAVILIARQYKAFVVSIIGQLGVLIASIFGMSVIENDSSFLLLTIFMIVGTSLFLTLQRTTYKQEMQYFLSLSDAFLLFIVGIYRISPSGSHQPLLGNIAAILLLLYCFLLFLYFIKRLLTPTTGSFTAFSFHTFFLILAAIELLLTLQTKDVLTYEALSILLLAYLFSWWISVSCSHVKSHARTIAFIMLFFFMSMIYQLNVSDMSNQIGLSVFFLPLLLVGSLKKDMLYKIGGYALLGMQLLFYSFLTDNFIFIILFTGLTLVLAGCLIYLDKEQYYMELKLTHYILFLAYIILACVKLDHSHYLQGISDMTMPICAFFTASITTFLMLCLGWCQNPNTKEPEPLMYGILMKGTQLFLVYGISLCYSHRISVWMHLFLILWLTVLCLLGFKTFISEKGIQKGSVILAVKYTVYILLILHSFTIHIQTITSIICLVIAITCILLGFRLETKYLRFYGLALTMLAIAKLLLIDINYTDSIARIISFLVCGILCFLINFIYSIAVKKYSKE